MSAFEDQLWSQLVSDHSEQIRQAEKATATLAVWLGERSPRRRGLSSSRRPSRRQLVFVATTLSVACLASAIIVAHTTTKNPTAPAINRTAFAVTDNHDGTLTITLDKRSALPTLNASLFSYGLKAKLPRRVPARTVSLTATCPKVPTLPGKGQPLAAGPPHAPLPGNAQRLKNCVLHATQ
jgi:hypothetical protein